MSPKSRIFIEFPRFKVLYGRQHWSKGWREGGEGKQTKIKSVGGWGKIAGAGREERGCDKGWEGGQKQWGRAGTGHNVQRL